MSIDSLKMDTIKALQEADKASQRIVGASLLRLLFLKNLVVFTEVFTINPVYFLTGKIPDKKIHYMYASSLKYISEDVGPLYGLTRAESIKILDDIAAEQLETLKAGGRQLYVIERGEDI